MNKKELYNRIDRYFEASLTRHEEHDLFHELLKFEGEDEIFDEALAVMLASRIPAKASDAKIRHFSRFVGAAAAVVAVIIAAGVLISHQPSVRDAGMIAYVRGVKVDDPHEIVNIIDNQLSDIGESSELFMQTVSEDLDDIRNAFNGEDL